MSTERELYTRMAFDPVNNPSHYRQGSIDCLDFIEDMLPRQEAIAYYRGNVIKYMVRAPHKNNEEEDYRKAAFYANKAAELASKVSKPD